MYSADNTEPGTELTELEHAAESAGIGQCLINRDLGRSQYTHGQRIQVALAYAYHGRIKPVALATGIPANTIAGWKHSAPWWSELMQEIRDSHGDLFRARLTRMAHKAFASVEDRIENGDPKLVRETTTETGPDGKTVTRARWVERRQGISARDANLIALSQYNTIRTIDGKPSKITINSGDTALNRLAAQFAALSDSYTARDVNALPVDTPDTSQGPMKPDDNQ